MQRIKLNKLNDVILVDASYYIFYRYFATYRWFSFQKLEHSPDDMINNAVFMEAFYKHIQSDLKKLCKKWSTEIQNIIFCIHYMKF